MGAVNLSPVLLAGDPPIIGKKLAIPGKLPKLIEFFKKLTKTF